MVTSSHTSSRIPRNRLLEVELFAGLHAALLFDDRLQRLALRDLILQSVRTGQFGDREPGGAQARWGE